MKKYCCLLLLLIMMGLIFIGCDKAKGSASPEDLKQEEVSEDQEVDTEYTENTVSEDTEAETEHTEDTVSEDTSSNDETSESVQESDVVTEADNTPGNETSVPLRTVVWLGDSLTQGSLGEDNDNLANAPYVKLQSLIPNKVEGYGLYGYNTHDIFWVYKDKDHYDQTVDPNKIYIFWVGSNDWCPIDGENTDTAPVTAQIDEFLHTAGVKDYIVMGTTQRWRLGLERAQIINAALSAHYGSHYMDVIDIIARNGFSEDNTHLSQASYDAIAEAVCNKLKALGYI